MRKRQILLIPDWTRWVTGTIALRIAAFNPWFDASVISQSIVSKALQADPGFLKRFDLIHFVGPDFTKLFPPDSFASVPVVTTIHHVLNWEDVGHNAAGDAVMTVAERYRREIADRGIDESRIVRVANVVDMGVFQEHSPAERSACRRWFGLRDEEFVVGFIGKQTSDAGGRKGVDLFVGAVQRVAERLDRLRLLIIGPGWGDLVADLRQRGIAVTWKSFLPKATDVSRAYGAMSCYAITSRVEGGPVPLLEAMATGTPAVSTRVGITPEVIEHERNGLLVDGYDSESIADALLRLANDEPLRQSLATRCRATIDSKHNAAVEMEKIPLLYRKAWDLHHADGSAEPLIDPGCELSSQTADCEATFRRFQAWPPLGAAVAEQRHWIRGEEELLWAKTLRQSGNRKAAWRSLATRMVTEPRGETLCALGRKMGGQMTRFLRVKAKASS